MNSSVCASAPGLLSAVTLLIASCNIENKISCGAFNLPGVAVPAQISITPFNSGHGKRKRRYRAPSHARQANNKKQRTWDGQVQQVCIKSIGPELVHTKRYSTQQYMHAVTAVALVAYC